MRVAPKMKRAALSILSAIGITLLIIVVSAAIQGRLWRQCHRCRGRLTVIVPRVAEQSLPPEFPPGFFLREREYLWCFRCWDGYNGVFEGAQEPIHIPLIEDAHIDGRAA